MKIVEIFLDTADLEEIARYRDFIDGVTTNPTIMSKYASGDYTSLAKKICSLVEGPVSVEVTAVDYDEMLAEGRKIAKIGDNVCVKLPCTMDGLRACHELSQAGIAVNMTLCFSVLQALFAAKAGATYVSPFVGRIDDVGQNGVDLIENIVNMYNAYGFETRVLAASIRSIQHLTQVAMIGADSVTVPVKILAQSFEHPLTTKGLEIFERDWNNREKK